MLQMIPVGYMAKRVSQKPDWLNTSQVKNIYSVSSCITQDFTNYINYWQHNGYWFFNSPTDIYKICNEHYIDLGDATMFYYEVCEYQYNDFSINWEKIEPETSFSTKVEVPVKKIFHGYDLVTFFAGTNPECSILSCNHLANEYSVNQHCLIDDIETVKTVLESDVLEECEPGPYRIFAVYTL